MNIAFATLVIILFLLPGFAFSRSYYSGIFSKNYIRITPFEILVSVVIPSLFFHYLGNRFSEILSGQKISFELLGKLLYNPRNLSELEPIFENIEANQGNILLYILSINLFALMMGSGTKAIVRNLKLDRRTRYLRFPNPWHYLLSGEIKEIEREISDAKKEIDFKFIDALVEVEGQSLLYSGFLEDYTLTDKKGIDHIILSHVERRPFGYQANDQFKGKIDSHMPGAGSLFIIPYAQILNMHISYCKIIEEEE